MEPLKIKVIVGSTRENRLSEKPAAWIFEELKKQEGVEAELLDLRDYPLPFFKEPTTPSTGLKGDESFPVAKAWADKIGEADAYIIATPEYNHGYPAVLKNALDYAYYQWNKKPVGFVSWGSVAGARAVEQLRLVAVELQMAPIRAAVHIPNIWGLLDKDGNLQTESLQKNLEIFFPQLIWWTKALKAARVSTSG